MLFCVMLIFYGRNELLFEASFGFAFLWTTKKSWTRCFTTANKPFGTRALCCPTQDNKRRITVPDPRIRYRPQKLWVLVDEIKNTSIGGLWTRVKLYSRIAIIFQHMHDFHLFITYTCLHVSQPGDAHSSTRTTRYRAKFDKNKHD
jgi:hypothetical protein